MCDWVGWDGHEEALAVTDTISPPWRVPVVIVAMFQHWSGTMRLGDQRFTQMHLSHSELACVITAQIPVPSLVGCLVTLACSVHSAGQSHKLRRQPVEQRRGLSDWDKGRRRDMEGQRQGAGFTGEVVFLGRDEWLQNERLHERKRWRQSSTNMKNISEWQRGWGNQKKKKRSFMYHTWGRSTERIDRWEKQTESRLLCASVQTLPLRCISH